MSRRKDESFPLANLLRALAPESEQDEKRLERQLTEKELQALRNSKLSGRMRWLLMRRATDEGEVQTKELRQARAQMREMKMAEGGIVMGPAGAGCNWFSVGPRNINGRIKALAIHPTDGSILYAGSAGGGVWKTSDGGQSWSPKMHDEDSLAIGAIAIDPSVPDIVYAGTGEAVYYLSSGVLQPPGAATLAWYYAGVGVYKSTNGGDTWTLTGDIENDFIYKLAVDPFDSQNVLCAGYSATAGEGGLCRSTDGGTSWTTVAQGIYTDVLFDPNNNGRAYAGQYNGGVWKSTDSGQTWNQRNAGLPATNTIGRVNLTLARANSNVLYVKLEDDATGNYLGAYRTATAAEAPGWTAITNPGVDQGYPWWCSHIAADPTDATGNIVYAGGVDLARSGNGGTSWTLVTDAYGGSRPPTHSDQHALVFDPADSNIIFISNDGGVFQGLYTGNATTPVTWKKVSTGLVATQFYDLHASSASRSMFGGGAQDNGSVVSTGGQSYRHVYGGDGGYVAFHPTDPYTVYVQFQNANIQRSTDGANTFVSARNGINAAGGTFPATVLAIDPSNPLILFSGTGRVYRTTNGGVGVGAWAPASANLGTVTEVSIAPSSSAVIYAGTLNGHLYRATDGGATAASFVDITPGVAGWPTRWLSGIAVDPSDSNTVYVTFLGFNGSGTTSDHVWKGVFSAGSWTWTLRAGGLPDVPVGALVIDAAASNLYIATDVGVFISTDDGVNWSPFEAGLPNTPIVDLALDSTRNILRAATHGRGIYQYDLGGGCPDVDIYLRDNILDTGEVIPTPWTTPDPTQPGAFVHHYNSADIKVDAPPFDATDALTDGVEFDDPEHPYTGFGVKIEDIDGIAHNDPIRTQVNRVYVQVHNRGWQKADSVTLKVIYADAGAGLPALPADFWTAFPADTFDQTNWKPVGTATVTDLLPNVPQIRVFNWTPPAGTSDHVCLGAMIHSDQDPLLPQTELNMDILTPYNKRVTHRNVHPVDPMGPSGEPRSAFWATLNFNNAFREHKYFDLTVENSIGVSGGLRVILPKPQLQDDLVRSLKGFKEVEVSGEELRRLSQHALKAGEMSEYVARLIEGFTDPLVLEVEDGQSGAAVRGVLIPPGEKIPAVFVFKTPEDDGAGAPFSFDVKQYERGRLIGGSQFVSAAKPGGRNLIAGPKRLRVILQRIQILNDRDPWILGRGEFSLYSEVRVSDPAHGERRRIPEEGYMKVSDRPGRNIVPLDTPIFEGQIEPNAEMVISLRAVEHDIFTADDENVRYLRIFSGDPASWVKSYRPDDEAADAENLDDWRVWYKIERV